MWETRKKLSGLGKKNNFNVNVETLFVNEIICTDKVEIANEFNRFYRTGQVTHIIKS